MLCGENGSSGRLNSFALVTYIPDPLGKFLDDLRLALVPGCKPHAHVSVLPPRPLSIPAESAWRRICGEMGEWEPFLIEPGRISIFPKTLVVYVELKRGGEELRSVHRRLQQILPPYEEEFEYHPHLTLAQGLTAGQVDEAVEEANAAWRSYQGPRSFLVDHVTFVQNTESAGWLDLAQCSLSGERVNR